MMKVSQPCMGNALPNDDPRGLSVPSLDRFYLR